MAKKDALSLLLTNTTDKVVSPKATVEIKRLSEIFKQEFNVVVKAIKYDDFKEIQLHAKDGDELASSLEILEKGLVEPDIRNKELQEKFGSPNYEDLLKKLFLPGEIINIAAAVAEVSGVKDDIVGEVKNL